MKRILLIKILLIYCFGIIKGQEDNPPASPIPSSPVVKEFEQYGIVPIDYSNGRARIEIPIYTIKSRSLSLPISASYISNGNKVDAIPSELGLGWHLGGTGVVSRQIRCSPDERASLNDSYEDEFIHLNSYQYTCTDCSNHFISDMHSERVDTEHDLFSVTAHGLSASFVIDKDLNVTLLDASLGIDITLTKTGTQITEIQVTNVDGTKYYFGGDYCMAGVSGPNGTNVSSAYTMWYLYKIQQANISENSELDEINIAYRKFTHIKSNRYHIITRENHHNCQLWDPITERWTESYESYDRYYLTGSDMYYHKYCPSEITFTGGRVAFDYEDTNRDDSDLKHWENRALESISVYNEYELLKHFRVRHYYLSSGGLRSQKRLMFSGLREYEVKNNQVNEDNYTSHLFEYNQIALPKYDSHQIDFWGFYNGESNNDNNRSTGLFHQEVFENIGNKNVGSGNRNVSSAFATAGMLEKITYPTGGYTEFVYESNRLGSSNDLLGGVRIAEVRSYSKTGDTNPIVKEYDYNEGRYLGLRYDKNNAYYSEYIPTVGDHYNLGQILVYEVDQTIFDPKYPEMNIANVPVFYTKVTEYSKSDDQRENGKTEYYYRSIIDQNDYFFYVRGVPTQSFELQRGKLSQKIIYKQNSDGTYNKVHSLYNSYHDKKHKATGVISSLYLKKNCYNNVTLDHINKERWSFVESYPYEMQIFSEYLQYTSEISYDGGENETENRTTFYYDSDKHPFQTSVVNTLENGNTATATYLYPEDVNLADYPEASLLKSAGMQNSVLESKNYYNDLLTGGTKNRYSGYHNSNYTIKPNSTYNILPDNSEEQVLDITYYPDENIKKIWRKDGTYEYYIWAYNKQYPVAKIVCNEDVDINITVSDNNLSKTDGNTYGEVSSSIYYLQGQLSSYINDNRFLVSIYTYKPLVGVTSTTDPNGISVFYEYDGFGRLQKVKDHEGNILKKHEYNYAN